MSDHLYTQSWERFGDDMMVVMRCKHHLEFYKVFFNWPTQEEKHLAHSEHEVETGSWDS
jgi:hypothetical protein